MPAQNRNSKNSCIFLTSRISRFKLYDNVILHTSLFASNSVFIFWIKTTDFYLSLMLYRLNLFWALWSIAPQATSSLTNWCADNRISVRTADYGVSIGQNYKDCFATVPANKRIGDTFDVSVHSKRAGELRYGQHHQNFCAIKIRERVQACEIENLQIARDCWKTSSPYIQPLDAVVNARNAINSENLARLEDFSKLCVSGNKAIDLCVRRHVYTFFWLYVLRKYLQDCNTRDEKGRGCWLGVHRQPETASRQPSTDNAPDEYDEYAAYNSHHCWWKMELINTYLPT